MKTTENIFGIEVYNSNLENLCNNFFKNHSFFKRKKVLVCVNPHSLIMAKKDPYFFTSFNEADIVIPDGTGVVLASRLLGGSICERITGFDVFESFSRRMNEKGDMACFFLGSSPEVLKLIEKKFSIEYPNVKIAGMYSPPFKPEFDQADKEEMVGIVNKANPDVLWVGMSAPKQEKWICQCRDQLNVDFIGAVGAVFDFYAGTVKRSPKWFLDNGLEWLPRLFQEPRRLWRRMFVSAPLFLFYLIKIYACKRWSRLEG